MKILHRNKKKFFYCLYDSTEPIYDEDSNEIGEKVLYEPAVAMYANISPATGIANTEQFGNLENYDKVIVTDDMSCPIDESTVLFIDKDPEYKVYQAANEPIYDYVVRRVAKSINSISIAVSKVKVT